MSEGASSSVDAIILVGGLGSRLRAVISEVPKPMAPVRGRPFLDVILAQLRAFPEVRRAILAAGYKAEALQAHYRDAAGFNLRIEFSIESEPLGTGGAVVKALRMTEAPHVLVMNGDSYVDFDLQALARLHVASHASVTMVVVAVPDTSRFGSVDLDATTQRVTGFREKAQVGGPGLVNAGCYLLSRAAFSDLPEGPASFERDILPRYLDSTYAVLSTGRFIDIGVPETYAKAAELLP
ncbi:MAG TPA: nucleotidyltransferase family protein [Steroidobacteraceae bacterium]|nr:nucleotidyltransferase family protein [Steroidobacteraceae bacterium]